MAIDGAAWVGFGGVVAGAVLGYASSAAQEAARRRHEQRRARALEEREDRIRFENRRFDAYVAMITAANRCYGLAKYPRLARGDPEDGADPSDLDAYLSPLSAAYEQFMTSLSPAFLTAGSNKTRDRIAALARSVRALVEAARATAIGQMEAPALEPLYRAHRQAVKDAEAAMREEFGLSTLHPPSS